jgi:hypothetical protein
LQIEDRRLQIGAAPHFPPVGILETLDYLCWFYGISTGANGENRASENGDSVPSVTSCSISSEAAA